MNAALKASIEAVDASTIRCVCGSIAIVGAGLASSVVWLLGGPFLGLIGSYLVILFLLVIAAWAMAAVLRLRIVGFLPSDLRNVDLIPNRLKRWIRWWLLVRFGLLGSGLIIIVAGVVAVVAQFQLLAVAVQAFIYIFFLRVFLDAVFGAVFNLGVISSSK